MARSLPNHLNTHRMNLIRHQSGECVVDQAMLGDTAEAVESRGGDPDTVMPAAAACAFVADVQVSFVDDFTGFGCKCFVEQLVHEFDARGIHGATCMKGLTVTLLQTPAAI